MTRERRLAVLSGIGAILAAVVFLLIAISPHVYAPGAYAIQQKLASSDDYSHPLLRSHRFGMAIFFVMRKAYSIVAFGIVGMLAAPALGPRPLRVARASLAIAAFSLAIEISEVAVGSVEALWIHAFDVGCGAVGGALGALVWNAFTRPRAKA